MCSSFSTNPFTIYTKSQIKTQGFATDVRAGWILLDYSSPRSSTYIVQMRWVAALPGCNLNDILLGVPHGTCISECPPVVSPTTHALGSPACTHMPNMTGMTSLCPCVCTCPSACTLAGSPSLVDYDYCVRVLGLSLSWFLIFIFSSEKYQIPALKAFLHDSFILPVCSDQHSDSSLVSSMTFIFL